MNQLKSALRGSIVTGVALVGLGLSTGCEVDGYFNPTKMLYGQHSPASIPILERIDVIEHGHDDEWSQAVGPGPEDLLPSVLEYRFAPGDIVTVDIFELILPGTFSSSQGRIDQSGNIRLPPPIRDFRAAGMTPRELEDAIIDFLDPDVLRDPLVTVSLDSGQGFFFTVSGPVRNPSIFPLVRPDLRLDQAMALAGGPPITTDSIYIVRPVALNRDYGAFSDPPAGGGGPANDGDPIDIDELIDSLDNEAAEGDRPPNAGVLQMDGEPILDIDDFNPRRIQRDPVARTDPFPPALARANARSVGASYVYIEERGEWVSVHGQDDTDITGDLLQAEGENLVLERIIKIPYQKLLSDSSYNIVIRPGDRIYVAPPDIGVVYIGGEIQRPGVYQLPQQGRLTLSTLVTAAGGLGPLAIPGRVDFTRRVGDNREATIRVNLAAIRQMTEPDIFIKADDHVIIGTNWIASPLAVMRNGFRATYGFGFLLDRNFGNDVFGAPPFSRR